MSNDTKHLGLNSQQLKERLGQYYGGDILYRSPLGSLNYTSGVRFFFNQAGNAGAYWLRDILATQPEVRTASRDDFALVILDVGDSGARLTVSRDATSVELEDGSLKRTPVDICYQRDIHLCDTQKGQWAFYIEYGIMMLPSEH